MMAQADDDPPQTSEPNRAGRRRQGMPMGMTEGMDHGMGMPPDFNQLDDATKEKIRQFRERAARGEMPLRPQPDD